MTDAMNNADKNPSATAFVNFRAMDGLQSQRDIKTIVVQSGRIADVSLCTNIPPQCDVIDLGGVILSPGFIDLQLNGCGGVLFNNSLSTKTLDTMHHTNLRSGCTSFLPTLITSSDEHIYNAIDVVRYYREQYPERVLGLHLEGPYLNPIKKGIHESAFIRHPTKTMLDHICQHADVISMITLAPEVCPEGTIEMLTEAGIVVSVGHTNATCAEIKRAEQAGARFATHLHNAMSPLGNREPGVVGAVLDSDRMGAGIIADGYHLAWENLRIAHRLMQDRLVLVTDATTPAGTELFEFEFAGQTIYHKNGQCMNADGTLAGSALTMIEAVKNSVNHGISIDAAIRMATLNAARAIHIDDQFGRIAIGQYANFSLFDDDFLIKGTVSGGRVLF